MNSGGSTGGASGRKSPVAGALIITGLVPCNVIGLGLSYPNEAGQMATGVAPNELTATADRDRFVGTPWHKHVPARVERVTA